MEDKYFIAGCAIIGISALGTMALYKDINGLLFTTAVSAITGIVGVCFGVIKGQKG